MTTDDTRTRLLNAAGPIFAEKGYKGATVREICDEAGVNVASVNYYFGDKERLYVESVKRAHPLSSAPPMQPDWPEGMSPAKKLHEFIRRAVEQVVCVETAPWQVELIMREMTHPTAACRELTEEYFRARFDRLMSILDEIVPADTPLDRRHKIAFSIVGQFVYYRVAGTVVSLIVGKDEFQEHFNSEQLVEHISQVCLAALGLAPPLVNSCSDASDDRPAEGALSSTENTKDPTI